ncbi:MAG: 16S rRNA (adenine(1518)-N(6)/adenine(1519)-N(6))-dimethyltransferase, partial [Bacteroidales bacterium]|nr:16S rRNA (adenine(1518)-N(6)/adenine(1519)-N(6))-dimethyltransferase [Bacteroidales bacterium]
MYNKTVRAKKSLGQHFLKDKNIAKRIVDSLDAATGNILEVGPGTGVLTQFLLQRPENLKLVEIDRES